MRTAVILALVACAALAQTVEIKGEQFTVGQKVDASEMATAKVVAYTAKHGDDNKAVFAGYVISRLPSQHFRINVTITMWSVLKDGSMHHTPSVTATASVDNPVPGRQCKFRAFSDRPVYVAGGWRYLYSTSLSIEKLPAKVVHQ